MTDEPKKVECPNCEGTGIGEYFSYCPKRDKLIGTKVTCPECKGTGWAEERADEEDSND